jgi:cytochrome c biogenesis protein CcmG/thiol:disulfide interchange protein DsbE
MRRLLHLMPMMLFLVLVFYFANTLWRIERQNYDPQVLPSAMLDKPAPAFTLVGLPRATRGSQDQVEESLSRDDLAGQVAVINFFASWCVPCRVEHPILLRLAREDHVRIYGIAYKDKPEDAARLLTQFGDPYQLIGMDRDGRVGLDFGVYGVPETYVLDKSGTIRKRIVGPLTADVVRTELLPLLKTLNGS